MVWIETDLINRTNVYDNDTDGRRIVSVAWTLCRLVVVVAVVDVSGSVRKAGDRTRPSWCGISGAVVAGWSSSSSSSSYCSSSCCCCITGSARGVGERMRPSGRGTSGVVVVGWSSSSSSSSSYCSITCCCCITGSARGVGERTWPSGHGASRSGEEKIRSGATRERGKGEAWEGLGRWVDARYLELKPGQVLTRVVKTAHSFWPVNLEKKTG